MEDGLTNEQVEKVLQLQDLTGIEDINVCRDVLIRHHWDLEVAFQEQTNIREGRPSMFAGSEDIRAPAVVNDRFLQQVFSAAMPGGRTNMGAIDSNSNSPIPRSIKGIIRYIINVIFQYCYSTISSIFSLFIGGNEQRIVTDPLGDVMNFIRSYDERYTQHPVFYQGTYAQALNDAKQELRFLLVYLHKDPIKCSDVDSFCRQTLSNINVIEFINSNTLFWGCDVSSPEGYRVSHSINSRTYPTMVLIALRANRMVIMGRFEGDCTAEELVRRLQTVINANDIWLSQARIDRLERNLTQTLRRQQDEAYRQSLIADEEKERKKEMEREKEREAQNALQRELEEAEERKKEIAKLKMDLSEAVPSEPPADAPNVINVVFKLPNGARIERRFLYTDNLNDVSNYLFCHPSTPDEFEITTNFPKRVIYSKTYDNTKSSSIYSQKTLADVGLKNREVLFVNDLDA